MDTKAVSRIKREFTEVLRSEEVAQCGIKLDLVNDCFTDLQAEITGPPDTPYEQGKFLLEIKVPDNYPFRPPKAKFLTKIWHPNISSVTGAICLDILKDNWVPSMTLRSVLLSLQCLLASPEPDDPQDAVVATQYKKNYEMFCETAKHWTSSYANGPSKVPDFDEKIQRIKDMGISEDSARAALSRCNWDLENAAEQFFN